MDSDRAKAEAIKWCYDGPWEEVKAFARVKLKDAGAGLDVDETRFSLKIAAEANPTQFMIERNNPANARKSKVLEAIERGILVEDKANNTIAYSSNPNQPLVGSVIGVPAVNRFVEASLTPDGQDQYTHLMGLMAPEAITPAVMNPVFPTKEEVMPTKVVQEEPIVHSSEESFTEVDKIYTEAIKKEIMVLNYGWHTVKTGPSKGQKIQGNKNTLLKLMKGDKELLDMIKSEILNLDV